MSAAIAAALGERLWTTDAFVPRYRPGEYGRWRISPGGPLVHDRGYHSGPCMLEMLPSLARKAESAGGLDGDRWETWMSLTPLEVESQELGFRHAFGNTVVMGLGMGWIAANCAMNPRVAQVTVVERDPEVIHLFHESGALDSLPESARRRIAIVRDDALEWRPGKGEAVDFLFADIWLRLGEPQALGQVRRMQANVRARQVYFWGQELAIHSAIARRSGSKDGVAVTADTVARAVNEVIGLPLLIAPDRDYARMIEQVVRNRIERGLPVAMNIQADP